jgi:glutaredoxin
MELSINNKLNKKSYNKYIDKIINNKNIFTIFYSPHCYYSIKAIELLKKKKVIYKKYNLDNIGGLSYVINKIIKNKDLIYFDINHKTKPIIFYNGKFIGGYSNLFLYFNNI